MLKVLDVRNVTEGYYKGIDLIREHGVNLETRNGPALSFPGTVAIQYTHPQERVLLDNKRDANPFFHLMESMWMLAGRQDVAWLDRYNSNMKNFSDDGKVFNAPYGHRLRNYPIYNPISSSSGLTASVGEVDQLDEAIKMLSENPNDRRVMNTIWDPSRDFGTDSKDIPCNDMIKWRITGNALNMVVFNRSNDAVWGCFGANAVHFSFIQEYVAAALDRDVGYYHQITTDLHLYSIHNTRAPKIGLTPEANIRNEELDHGCIKKLARATPKINHRDFENFNNDLEKMFVDHYWMNSTYDSQFFNLLVIPMMKAWAARKNKESVNKQLDILEAMPNCDWRRAAVNWITRREEAKHASKTK